MGRAERTIGRDGPGPRGPLSVVSRILLFGFGVVAAALVGSAVPGCGGRTLVEVEVAGDAGGQNSGSTASTGSEGTSGSSGSSGSGSPIGTSGSSGSSPSGSSGGSGSPTDFYKFFVCPPTRPWANTVCDTAGLVCAYYSNAGCISFVCDDSLSWQTSTQGC
jgi:hypothetical protein